MAATSVAATGVHKPISRSSPAPMPNTDNTVTRVEGSLYSRASARQIKANPSTTRIRRRPTPGQPWANVENRRRKGQLSLVGLFILGNFELGWKLQRESGVHSFGWSTGGPLLE